MMVQGDAEAGTPAMVQQDPEAGAAPLGGFPGPFADLDGDGFEEVIVVGDELDGLARGPLVQGFKGNGTQLAFGAVGSDFTGAQHLVADLNGVAGGEIAVLKYRMSDGAWLLDVRNSAGTVTTQIGVSGPGFYGAQLFPINLSAFAGTEIGVGFVRGTDAAAFYAIFRLSGGALVLHQIRNVLLDDRRDHFFAAGDFNDDGNEDVFVGGIRDNGVADVRIWNTAGAGSLLVAVGILPGAFADHHWLVGQFTGINDPSDVTTGPTEFAILFRRESDNAKVLQVYDATATATHTGVVLNSAWGQVTMLPLHIGGTGGTADCCPEIFIGSIRNSDQVALGQVWDPSIFGSFNLVSQNVLTSAAITQHDWATGQFSGTVATSEEYAFVFQEEAVPGRIGQGIRTGSTGALVGQKFVLGCCYLAPRVFPVMGWAAGRFDVLIVAHDNQFALQRPVAVANTAAGANLFSKFVLTEGMLSDPKPRR
jgi:hypothetical protein